MPDVTAAELNRATLARQLLLRRQPLGVEEGVRQVVALQGQHAASPYLALWNRLVDLDPRDVDEALRRQALVKATLMRVTLHVVHVDDHATMHAAMQPTLRGARLNDGRFTGSGLGVADADALLPGLAELTRRPRTVAEIEEWLAGRHPGAARALWWALRSYAPLWHAPTGGPWTFGQRPSFVAARVPVRPAGDHDPAHEALQLLVLRYLRGFGPASVADVAQFALVQRSRARAALAARRDELQVLRGPDGAELFDVPGAPRPPGDTPAPPRLMAMWDSTLLAYSDRSRVVPPGYRRLVTRTNGDVLPTLLVDGQVAGVWRPVPGGVEATAFHELPPPVWDGLAAEAVALTAFLAEREPAVYRRHEHWWSRLSGAQVRVLPDG